MSDTIYERIGGESAVEAAVDIFYRKVLMDQSVALFFDSVDMNKQRDEQKAFLTMVFGGPNHFNGQDLRIAHAPLVKNGLNETHFMAVATHLKETLEELKVAEDVIKDVMGLVAGKMDDVLNR